MDQFTNRPNYGCFLPKVDPPHQQVLVSSPKEVTATNDLSSLHSDVTAGKNKRKKKSYWRSFKKKYQKEKETSKKRLLLSTRKMMTNRKT